MVVSLNGSSANVSWRALDVPRLPVSYTLLYSRVSQPPAEEENETIVVFQPPATSGVITGLVPLATYQIQVFATVTVGGVEIAGNKSYLVYFANGELINHVYTCLSSALQVLVFGVHTVFLSLLQVKTH